MTSKTIELDWDSVPSHQQNGPIIYYTLMIIAQEASTTLTLNVNSTSTTVSNLHPSYNYSIEIAAVTTSTGPFSGQVSVKTHDDGELYIETNFQQYYCDYTY